MNYAKAGFYAGALGGLILFIAAWLLPVSFIGGVSGSKIQQYVSGNSHGLLAVIFMVLIVIASGTLITALSSFAGWVAGTVISALKSPKPQTEGAVEQEAAFNATPVRADEA